MKRGQTGGSSSNARGRLKTALSLPHTQQHNKIVPLRTQSQMKTQKSHRTRTVEQIQRNHRRHRNSAIEIIQKQQAERRTSLHARLQARQKAKHSDVLAKTQIFSELSVASRALIVDAMEFEVVKGKGTDVCVQGERVGGSTCHGKHIVEVAPPSRPGTTTTTPATQHNKT